MKKFAEHGEYMSNLNGVGITGRGGALGRQGRMAERGDDSGEELGEAHGVQMRSQTGRSAAAERGDDSGDELGEAYGLRMR